MSDDSSSSSSDLQEEEEEKKPKSSLTTDVKSAKNGEQPKKKKKKNAPDRPQPAWLFPPDAENPVLNPKSLSEEEKRKAYEERMEAIKFLKHKSVSAPMKTAPPSQLLTLIGGFLASYGFNSTGRLFTLERNARKKLDGWNDQVGAKLEKGMPDLVKIFKDWSKEWHERRELDMTSSEEDDDAVTKRAKMVKKREKLEKDKTAGADDTSSSGSESSSSSSRDQSESVSKKVSPVKASSSGSSASSTSESEADDEKDVAAKTNARNPTLGAMVNNLKRKVPSGAAQGSASTSKSDSNSDSDTSSSDSPQKKKKKVIIKLSAKALVPASTKMSKISENDSKSKKADLKSSSSSSKEITSQSESEWPATNGAAPKPSTLAATLEPPLMNGRTSSTDSSTTLGNSSSASNSKSHKNVATSSSVSSTSDSEAPAPKQKSAVTKETKRKRSPSPKPGTANTTNAKVPKKTNTPFSRIPQDTKVDPKLASNAYVPYDYAEKAHQDLIATKGKGFTKEKNKKKRGA